MPEDNVSDVIKYIDTIKEYVQSFHEYSLPFKGEDEIVEQVRQACYAYVFSEVPQGMPPGILAAWIARNLFTYTELGAKQYEHGVSSALIVEQLLIDKWLNDARSKRIMAQRRG